GEDLLRCPDIPAALGFSVNGQVISLLGEPKDGANYYQSVVKLGQVAEPSGIVLLGDSIPTNPQFGNITRLTSVPMEFAYPHPALVADHTSDPTWEVPWLIEASDGKNN